ncbi:heterokaryon incompatibility protein-domain-containing protein [Hypoxylon trugodes]|uniref:heterokaryon incompatibility protein-domain-containing protein n=1 Tax=Hypoxylon trugodes TaxID=326681 RepID=UPI0021A0B7B5|nr:heterokaryon incompatibility protein-domain-containing protein [Hypoxylon trugodes]KAI1390578.1 heterokaryon incompatibility protein-domain-containing protein [Hypoxylon trugodes]
MDLSQGDLSLDQARIQFRTYDHKLHAAAISSNVDSHGTPFESYDIPIRRRTYADALFEESSQWARKRISECLKSHESCQQYHRNQRDATFIPSRLINIDPTKLEGDVVLETRDTVRKGHVEVPKYVALSYCWGLYKPECLTTAETVARNMQRIPWSMLPATFRDAINFTRCLGINYIWIDSVCIIQGDKEDWVREAGSMFDVYRNSYVTLAALYGDSSDRGLRSMSMQDQLVKIADLGWEKDRYPVYIRPEPHYLSGYLSDIHEDAKNTLRAWGPLFYRAWTYQERMIAPRVILFDKSEIIFQCYSTASCECGAITEELMRSDRAQKFTFFDCAIDTDRKSRSTISHFWRSSIAGEFGGLDITNPSDRLIALGAIAKQFQRAFPGEEYLAGLWSGSFIQEMLWFCPDLDAELYANRKQTLNRPYSLPTWSWASLKGSMHTHVDPPDDKILATVVKAECQYGNDNRFGILKSSFLILCSRLLPTEIKWAGFGFTLCLELNALTFLWMDHDGTGYQNDPERQEVYLLEMV